MRSRTARSTPCYPCWWSTPSTFRWTDWIPQSCANPLLTSHGPGDSRTVESVFLRCPCNLSFLSELLNEVFLDFCNQRYRDRFPRTSSDDFPRTPRFVRFDGRRMFLLRDYIDPVVHDANSAWLRLAVTLGIGILCTTSPLQSSCIPLSQCITQVQCWEERLRGIVFDRTAILFSERVWNCTNVLYSYSGELSPCSCTPRFWVCPDRIEFLPDLDWRTSGSRLWKNTDCLSLLRLFPPRISRPWMMECMSWAFPMWLMQSAKSLVNSTLSCNVGSTRVPLECPWIALKYRKCSEEWGFQQIETFSFVLLLLPGSSCMLTRAKYPQTLT